MDVAPTPLRHAAPRVVLLAALGLSLGACGRTPPQKAEVKAILGTEKKLYSQNDEELIIRQFFQDERDGFFLDVGCADPIRQSTTYYLEKHLGWSGIAIDAQPAFAPMWERERPATPFLQYAVMDKSGEEIKLFVSGVASVSREIVEMWGGPQPKTITVPTITLNQVLDDRHIERIDFLSMDIEGAEPMALAGFDIQRFHPRLVCIEAHTSPEHERTLTDYFQRNGYQRQDEFLAYDNVNWYFAPSDR